MVKQKLLGQVRDAIRTAYWGRAKLSYLYSTAIVPELSVFRPYIDFFDLKILTTRSS